MAAKALFYQLQTEIVSLGEWLKMYFCWTLAVKDNTKDYITDIATASQLPGDAIYLTNSKTTELNWMMNHSHIQIYCINISARFNNTRIPL